jgi:uncharacterized OsmC-like protein
MAIETFKAKAVLKDKYLVETEARGHKLVIDEPKELGGTDQGINPVEAVLAALGACQSVVARTYAKQFDVSLKNFRVELEGDIDLDGFFNKSDVRPGFSDIRYIFHIETDAPEEKVQAFKEFLEAHCPVGDSLANTVNLDSTVVIKSPVNN